MEATNINNIIEVRTNNLYANGYHVEFRVDGEGLLLRDKFVFKGDPKDSYHTLMEGESLDAIAYKHYSGQLEDASKYWGIIADANNVFNPFDLTELVGTDLLIPDIQKVKLLI